MATARRRIQDRRELDRVAAVSRQVRGTAHEGGGVAGDADADAGEVVLVQQRPHRVPPLALHREGRGPQGGRQRLRDLFQAVGNARVRDDTFHEGRRMSHEYYA